MDKNRLEVFYIGTGFEAEAKIQADDIATKQAKKAKFYDSFAIDENTGSYVYKADACCKRFDMPREAVNTTRKEDWVRQGWFGKTALREESNIITKVLDIMNRLHIKRITEDISLEEFIEKHVEVIA